MKRFSGREFGILAAPILGIGAVAWWISSHPAPFDNRPAHLEFRIEKPTTLEAFRGANVAFVLDVEKASEQDGWMLSGSPYLKVQTSAGLKTSHRENGKAHEKWELEIWNFSVNNSRFLLKTSEIPAGELRFGVKGAANKSSSAGYFPPVPLSGEWDVDRSKFAPFPFHTLKRAPNIELRVLEITNISKRDLTIDAVFLVTDNLISEDATLETDFHEKRGRFLSTQTGTQKSIVTAQRRVRQLRIGAPLPGQDVVPYIITGRVSIDNRWPLDFESQPFDFKTAKVGQRIKFKQFLAPLPKK